MALKKNPKYDLRAKYLRVFEISLIISLLFLVLSFKYFPHVKKEKVRLQAPQELVKVEDVANTKQETPPPPPPKPLIPIEAPSDKVLNDITLQSTELDQNTQVSAPPPPKENKSDNAEPTFFVAVEQMPRPIGGITGIQRRIVYPEIAKRAGVQGRVFVKAFVDKHGNVIKVELIKGIGAGCDEAALKAVKETKFIPGRQRGKPVNVQIAIPILFKLQ